MKESACLKAMQVIEEVIGKRTIIMSRRKSGNKERERYEEGTTNAQEELSLQHSPSLEIIRERGESLNKRKVFRVFVSSTFLDMKRERNVLRRRSSQD